jgi:hypothetical protein
MLRGFDNYNNYSTLEAFKCDTMDLDMEKKELLSFIIYSSNKSLVYTRKYIKIPDIIAAVGGIMQVFYVFFKIVNGRFANIAKYEKIIKRIFYCEDKDLTLIDKNIENKSLFEKSSSMGSKTNSHLQNIKVNTLTINMLNPDYLAHRITQQNQKLNLKFSLWGKLKVISERFCNGRYEQNFKTKLNLYEIAKLKIKNYFNFITIIRKFEEFDKLKKLMFDQDQLNMFKLNRKTKLSINDKKILHRRESIGQDEIKKYIEDFLNRLKSNPDEMKYDEKILNLLCFN